MHSPAVSRASRSPQRSASKTSARWTHRSARNAYGPLRDPRAPSSSVRSRPERHPIAPLAGCASGRTLHPLPSWNTDGTWYWWRRLRSPRDPRGGRRSPRALHGRRSNPLKSLPRVGFNGPDPRGSSPLRSSGWSLGSERFFRASAARRSDQALRPRNLVVPRSRGHEISCSRS